MRVLLTLAAVGAIGGITACNTIQGIGADLTAGGSAIEEAAAQSRQPTTSYGRPPVGSTVFDAGPSRDQDPSLAAKPTNIYRSGQQYPAPPAYETQPAYGARSTYQSTPSYPQPTPSYQSTPTTRYEGAPAQTYIKTPTYQSAPTQQPTYIY